MRKSPPVPSREGAEGACRGPTTRAAVRDHRATLRCEGEAPGVMFVGPENAADKKALMGLSPASVLRFDVHDHVLIKNTKVEAT